MQLAFITDATKRKAVYKRRKNELIRKINELNSMYGVDACVIIKGSELSPQLQFLPSESDAKRVVAKFQNFSLREQSENMVDQREILKTKIAEAEKKLEKLIQDNRKKELTERMYDVMAGRSSLQNLGMEDLVAIGQLVGEKMFEVEKRIELLSGSNLSQVGGATSEAGVMAKGAGEN